MQIEKLLQSFLQYNLWANRRLLENISTLSPEKIDSIPLPPFENIYNTLFHIYGAQYIWFERIHGRSPKTFPVRDKDRNLSLLNQTLIKNSAEWNKFFQDDPKRYNTTIEYFNTIGESFNQSAADIAIHMVNHGTYHRGQIMSAVRSVFQGDLAPLDYIYFLRSESNH